MDSLNDPNNIFGEGSEKGIIREREREREPDMAEEPETGLRFLENQFGRRAKWSGARGCCVDDGVCVYIYARRNR